jgi:hypothetical protein
MKAAIMIAVQVAALAMAGQETTIRIPHVFGTDVVRFDPSRVSPAELRRWLTLSPILGTENGYVVPENVRLCVAGDARYQDCGKGRGTLNLHNARVNIEAIRSRIRLLDDRSRYPSDLSAVVSYVRHVQSFNLWADTQLLDLAETGDISVLERKFDAIDPGAACPGVLRRIAQTKDRAAAFEIAWHDWYNCLWNAEVAKIGGYPQKEWEEFLSARGISEHDEQEPAD